MLNNITHQVNNTNVNGPGEHHAAATSTPTQYPQPPPLQFHPGMANVGPVGPDGRAINIVSIVQTVVN